MQQQLLPNHIFSTKTATQALVETPDNVVVTELNIADHSQGDHSFSTTIFHDQKMNFHDLSAQHIFFEINDTRFMNAYQNKNIFPVARQSVSK